LSAHKCCQLSRHSSCVAILVRLIKIKDFSFLSEISLQQFFKFPSKVFVTTSHFLPSSSGPISRQTVTGHFEKSSEKSTRKRGRTIESYDVTSSVEMSTLSKLFLKMRTFFFETFSQSKVIHFTSSV
jgi:hypothetical protein